MTLRFPALSYLVRVLGLGTIHRVLTFELGCVTQVALFGLSIEEKVKNEGIMMARGHTLAVLMESCLALTLRDGMSSVSRDRFDI